MPHPMHPSQLSTDRLGRRHPEPPVVYFWIVVSYLFFVFTVALICDDSHGAYKNCCADETCSGDEGDEDCGVEGHVDTRAWA